MTEQEHWLWRLDAHSWMVAAVTELELAREHVAERGTSITHARRAAGMALNAALVVARERLGRERVEQVWGRSYTEHLVAIVEGRGNDVHAFGPELRKRAKRLLELDANPSLIQLRASRRPDPQAREAADAATALCSAIADLVP